MTPHRSRRVSRLLLIIGLTAVAIGTVDPLEGAMVILGGFVLVTLAAYLRESRHRVGLSWSASLVAVGVGALFLFSALGGIGGSSGRSAWWALTFLPYPVGWMLGILESIRLIRDSGDSAPPNRSSPAGSFH